VSWINESLSFVPVRVAILSISDTRTPETDSSGALLADRVQAAGHVVSARAIVPDNVERIRESVTTWANDPNVDVIISTGGTGLTGRDVTPEAVVPLFDKTIDGFPAIFHRVSFESVGLSTLQSRACAGIVKGTFVFCLPGSNGAVKDGWDKVIRDQLDARHKPCNFVELMPRLNER
jgi:molybdopterin adenylyltransferase